MRVIRDPPTIFEVLRSILYRRKETIRLGDTAHADERLSRVKAHVSSSAQVTQSHLSPAEGESDKLTIFEVL